MNWRPFFYKWHKWCSVAAGLLTFIWFGSGVVMMLPERWFQEQAPPHTPPAVSPDFREARIAISEAIAAVEGATGRAAQITGVSLRQFPGHLVYSLSTPRGGPLLVDAITGERIVITEQLAREIALASRKEITSLGSGSTVEKYNWEYTWGPLPAYRFEAGDSAGTIAYVGIQNGEVRSSSRAGRIRVFLADSHTLRFLRPILPVWSLRLVMLIFSIVGLAMTVLGGAILWLHFRNWWQGRWRTA